MAATSEQEKILAYAIYEIRLLLSGYLGSETEGDLAVRQAAHLAYALHNFALDVVAGRSFNAQNATSAIAAADALLGSEFVSRFIDAGIEMPA